MKQTFIAIVVNPTTNERIDFQRWSYKKAETVAKMMQELAKSPIFKGYKGAECRIYATPDGYHQESNPTLSITLK